MVSIYRLTFLKSNADIVPHGFCLFPIPSKQKCAARAETIGPSIEATV